MEPWLSIVGFLVVIGIIVSIMTQKLSAMVALSVIPLIGAILVGQFTSIPAYLAAGISKAAVNGVMFVFAILFFGTMMTAGAFHPIVKFIIKCCRGNPLYVCIGTYVLSIVGHLDGSATTTVLLVCGAMIPIYQKMHMRLRNLAAILAMAAGLMNISPWGGPTLRAATVMEADLTGFFQPMLAPILITIAVGLIPVVLPGLSETKRLKAEGFDYAGVSTEHHAEELSEEERSLLHAPSGPGGETLLFLRPPGERAAHPGLPDRGRRGGAFLPEGFSLRRRLRVRLLWGRAFQAMDPPALQSGPLKQTHLYALGPRPGRQGLSPLQPSLRNGL